MHPVRPYCTDVTRCTVSKTLNLYTYLFQVILNIIFPFTTLPAVWCLTFMWWDYNSLWFNVKRYSFLAAARGIICHGVRASAELNFELYLSRILRYSIKNTHFQFLFVRVHRFLNIVFRSDLMRHSVLLTYSGAFAKFQKATLSCVMCVWLSLWHLHDIFISSEHFSGTSGRVLLTWHHSSFSCNHLAPAL